MLVWGGLAFNAASSAINAACIGYLALGIGVSFAGGFIGNIAGTVATNLFDSKASLSDINWSSTIMISAIMGGLNVFTGMSTIVGNTGKVTMDLKAKLLAGYWQV